MKEKKYLYLAIVVSPFLGVLISNILVTILTFPFSTKHIFDALLESLVPALYGGFFLGLPAILCIGLPLYLLIKKMKMHTPWIYALFGFFASMLIVMLLLTKNTQPLSSSDIPAVLRFGLHGIAVALVFWWFAVQLRDRSEKKL